MNILDEKAKSRAHFKALRSEICKSEHISASYATCQYVAELLPQLKLESCAIYHPISSELSPLMLHELLPHLKCLLPYLHHHNTPHHEIMSHTQEMSYTQEMSFSELSGGELDNQLVQGKYRIMQPAHHSPFIPQAIITPLLAIDANGTRLGYGGGYYDRYFAIHPNILRIGIGFYTQLTNSLPCEPHDAKLHYFICERGVINFNRGLES